MAIASTNMTTTYNNIIVEKTTELLMGQTVAGAILANSESDRGGRVGNTIVYHRAPKGTVQNASEGTGNSKTYATPVGTTDTLTLDYFKEVPFEADDLDQNVIGNTAMAIDAYADSGAKVLAQQIDSDILEDIFDDAGIVDNTAVGTSGTALNASALTSVRSTLVKLGVNPADIVVLLTPDHSADLMSVTQFASADFIQGMPTINGQLPRNLFGMAVYFDAVNLPTLTAADSISGSSTTQYLSIAMYKESAKFVSAPLFQPATQNAVVSTSNIDGLSLRSKMWYDPDLNASRLVVDALYGVKLTKTATVQGSDNSMAVVIRGGVA